MKNGDIVIVDIGHRHLTGHVVDVSAESEYVTVKHDNFKGEVFNKKQVTVLEDDLFLLA